MPETYRSQAEANAAKQAMESLRVALNAAHTTLYLDECRAWRLTGRRGHVYDWGPNGGGWLIFVACRSPRQWTFAKRRMTFATVTQDGDDEGCFRLHQLPTPEQAAVIRDVVGLRQTHPWNGIAPPAAQERHLGT